MHKRDVTDQRKKNPKFHGYSRSIHVSPRNKKYIISIHIYIPAKNCNNLRHYWFCFLCHIILHCILRQKFRHKNVWWLHPENITSQEYRKKILMDKSLKNATPKKIRQLKPRTNGQGSPKITYLLLQLFPIEYANYIISCWTKSNDFSD